METRTFFSDESERFVSYSGTGSERTVHIRLRTGRYQAEKVLIIYQGDFHEMTWESEKNNFDFYGVTLPAAEDELVYHFQINTSEGICFYDRAGSFEFDRSLYPFRLYPDFIVPEWLKGAVMYQIFPDRYRNGDHSNDVVKNEYYYLNKPVKAASWDKYRSESFDVGNFCGGDLQGIIDELDYIKELGVEVLYLNPVFVSPSNHKYDIQDYDHIDPHLGRIVRDEGSVLPRGEKENSEASKYISRSSDPANLKASDELFAHMVEQCHQRGIRVILDGVFNHCSHFNKWMNREGIYERGGAYLAPKSKYHDYFHFTDKKCTAYECWWDHISLPKLNYEESEELCEEILRIGEKWVSPPFNADGWRLDVAADLGHSEEFNHSFWKRFRKRVKTANPEAVIIAEHYEDAHSWLQGDEWDTIMNYTAFMEPVSWFFTGMDKHSDHYREDLHGNAEAFQNLISTAAASIPYQSLTSSMNQLDNHDHSRFLTRTNGLPGRLFDLPEGAAETGVKKAVLRQAAAFMFTWTGSPCIYYGDEAGLCGYTDPDNRRPYPWGNEDGKLREFFVKCAGLRDKYSVLKDGSCRFIMAEDNVVAFTRFNDKGQIYAVFSVSDEEQHIDIPVWAGGRAGYIDEDRLTCVMSSGKDGFTFEEKEVKVNFGLLKYTIPPDGAVIFYGKDSFIQ